MCQTIVHLGSILIYSTLVRKENFIMLQSKMSLTATLSVLAVFAMCLVSGCDQDNQGLYRSTNTDGEYQYVYQFDPDNVSVSMQLENSLVHLYNPLLDGANNRVVLPYQTKLGTSALESRLLIVSSEAGGVSSFEARIYDDSSRSILLCKVEISPTDSNTIYFYEVTATDTLMIQRTLVDDRIHETYLLNGKSYDLDFTIPELEGYLLICDRGIPLDHALSGAPQDAEGKFSKFARFNEFYQEDLSINSNRDGEILTELLTTAEFQAWFIAAKSDLGVGTDPGLTISAEKVCGIAGVTAFAKCWFGGIANFVCVAATGTSLACSIAAIAG